MTIRNTLNVGNARAMFSTPTTGSMMARGPQISYAAEDDAGAVAEAAAAAVEAARAAKAVTEAAAKTASDEAAAAAAEAAAAAASKLTDEEARLLKEVMKHKRTAEKNAADLASANKKLEAYEGLDPTKMRELVTAQEAAELKAAESRGEYDRIVAANRVEFDKQLGLSKAETAAALKQVADSNKRIDDLVIGSAFSNSRFVNDNTVLPGDKARRLFGDHFEMEDGRAVAYDKPRGSADRTPLTDPRTGSPLQFEAAIEKIMRGDPDFDRIAKGTLKPGSGSGVGEGERTTLNTPDKKPLVGVAAISFNLKRMQEAARAR